MLMVCTNPVLVADQPEAHNAVADLHTADYSNFLHFKQLVLSTGV